MVEKTLSIVFIKVSERFMQGPGMIVQWVSVKNAISSSSIDLIDDIDDV